MKAREVRKMRNLWTKKLSRECRRIKAVKKIARRIRRLELKKARLM